MKLGFCSTQAGQHFVASIDGTTWVDVTATSNQTGLQAPSDILAYCKGPATGFLQLQKILDAPTPICVEPAGWLLPLQPVQLLDFGLTPRHLKLSARVMLRNQFGPLLGPIAAWFVCRGIDRKTASPVLQYYKGNHTQVVADNAEIPWPSYTSYLDIEPELAVVAGNATQPIAGYMLYNDLSARDIQFPEMLGTGPARSKDFASGNQIGPWLVTPDEIADPNNLAVEVHVNGQLRWQGSTRDHARTPQQMLAFLAGVFPVAPGAVLGMGTIPGCTGLDNNDWLRPGDDIQITMGPLGQLSCRFGPCQHGNPGPWPDRKFS